MEETGLGTHEAAKHAKAAAKRAFEAFGEVVGIGLTHINGGYGLKINLREAPSCNAELPTEIEGVPVHVEIVGTITKYRG